MAYKLTSWPLELKQCPAVVRARMADALLRAHGDVEAAADQLGISRRQWYRYQAILKQSHPPEDRPAV